MRLTIYTQKKKFSDLTLPRCRIAKDVGHHGSPVFSPARHLQKFHRSRSSSNSFCQAIQKFNSRSSSSSSAIQPSSHAIILHLLASHDMVKKPQLSPSNQTHHLPLSSCSIQNWFVTSPFSFQSKNSSCILL